MSGFTPLPEVRTSIHSLMPGEIPKQQPIWFLSRRNSVTMPLSTLMGSMNPRTATCFSFKAFTGAGIWLMIFREASAALVAETGASLPVSKLKLASLSNPASRNFSFFADAAAVAGMAVELVAVASEAAVWRGAEFVAGAGSAAGAAAMASPRRVGAGWARESHGAASRPAKRKIRDSLRRLLQFFEAGIGAEQQGRVEGSFLWFFIGGVGCGGCISQRAATWASFAALTRVWTLYSIISM